MKKKLYIILAIVFILVLTLVGCIRAAVNSTHEEVAKEPPKIVDLHTDDGRIVVGISMPDKTLERWNRDGAFLQSRFKDNGYEVMLKYADNLIDRQINDIREMIAQGADLLVITAVDGAALTKVLEEASAANVRIIAYDRLLMSTPAVDYYVSFDNYRVGVLQAEHIIDRLNLDTAASAQNIEFISGDPVDNNARYFYNGAMDTLAPYLESGKLTVKSNQKDFYETSTSQWSSEIAQQRLQIILNSYYPEGTTLNAVLCANDSTALGATKALTSDYMGENKVFVTGQDGDVANIYNILSGLQSMTVYKELHQEAVVTVALGTSILKGHTPQEDLIKESDWDFECSFDAEEYDNGTKKVPSYLLSPIPITLDNIEKELFESGRYRRDSSGVIYAAK